MDINTILITDPYNLRYFTGFRGGEGYAFLSGNDTYVIVDSRYTEAAKAESPYNVIEYNRERPLKTVFKELCERYGFSRIGFEDMHLTVHELNSLRAAFPEGLEWIPVGDILSRKRRVKTPEELRLLEKAEGIGDSAFSDILGILKPGITEKDVARELEYSMKKHGAEGFSFDTIAASGINSSKPHAIPSDKRLETGDFLTMDFGCIYKGYCSDMTRTVVIGKASDEQRRVYDIVLKAQLTGLEAVRSGAVCKDVDSAARGIIEREGYGKYFGHGLGHSVGLYIHESPALNTRDETVLQAGMIETVEPGIYLPGRFGVRIEDMVCVTEDGCKNYAHSPKELIEL